MGHPLPGWVEDDAESVRAEAAPYIGMTPEERARHLKAACRAAARMIRSRADAERVLAFEDPLPDSSRRALERLRREAQGR